MANNIKKIDFLLLASGEGNRFSKKIRKQFVYIGNKTIIEIAIENILKWRRCKRIILVCSLKNIEVEYQRIIKSMLQKYNNRIFVTDGGKYRKDSVFNGLNYLEKNVVDPMPFVAIHDCARPFIKIEILERIFNKFNNHIKGIVPALPIVDTIKTFKKNKILKTLDRNKIIKIQTPQFFNRELITNLYKKIYCDKNFSNLNFTDDSSIFETFNYDVAFVKGDYSLEKITFLDDIKKLEMNKEIRTGLGFDVHKFSLKKTKPLILFGIEIDYNKSLIAHSDGDVGLHALCDSILGSISQQDIGYHFPPSDKKWLNYNSEHFLNFAIKKLKEKNAIINNIDITVLCEMPKINPYRLKIIDKLSKLTNISKEKISIKSTTTESLGFIGRKEGIAVISQITISIFDL